MWDLESRCWLFCHFFPFPSLPFSQMSCISTAAEQHHAALIPPAGQQITDQVDHLLIAWGAAVCGRSLGSWGFSIWETMCPQDLAGSGTCQLPPVHDATWHHHTEVAQGASCFPLQGSAEWSSPGLLGMRILAWLTFHTSVQQSIKTTEASCSKNYCLVPCTFILFVFAPKQNEWNRNNLTPCTKYV